MSRLSTPEDTTRCRYCDCPRPDDADDWEDIDKRALTALERIAAALEALATRKPRALL